MKSSTTLSALPSFWAAALILSGNAGQRLEAQEIKTRAAPPQGGSPLGEAAAAIARWELNTCSGLAVPFVGVAQDFSRWMVLSARGSGAVMLELRGLRTQGHRSMT